MGVALTIGNFDGVHIGHRALIQGLIDFSKKEGLSPKILTFDPHPLIFLRGKEAIQLLSPTEEKKKILHSILPGGLEILPFDAKIASMPPEEFFSLLLQLFPLKAIFIGPDFRFGKKKEGTVETLRTLAKKHAIACEVYPFITSEGGSKISSTHLRHYIKEGKLDAAQKLLGQRYWILGPIEKGTGRGGALLGFKTANIHYFDCKLLPEKGVYQTKVTIKDSVYPCLTNIGVRPTLAPHDLHPPLKIHVEVHIPGLIKDCPLTYGTPLWVELVCKIRDEKKFDSIDALKAQIQEDILWLNQSQLS